MYSIHVDDNNVGPKITPIMVKMISMPFKDAESSNDIIPSVIWLAITAGGMCGPPRLVITYSPRGYQG